MTLPAFALIFISIFLHVGWNMLSKSTKPSMAFYALMSATASLIWLPFFLASAWRWHTMPWNFHFLVLFSIFGEVIYVLGLARAYRRSDISLVYPVARALPVLFTAGITLTFGLGKRFGMGALGGMVLITVGCLMMPLNGFRDFSFRSYCNSAIGYILMAAAGTTIYTLVDSVTLGMLRKTVDRVTIVDTLAYLFLIEFGLMLGDLIVIAFNPLERQFLKRMAFRSIYPILAGCFSSSAYAMVLLAMAYVTNVSYIQAFRQMSLPLGFLAGMVILKEKATRPKVAGMLLIVAGLISVSLG